MAKFVSFTENDMILETSKVTTGFFSGGVGTLAGSNLVTASLSSTQKKYYYNLQYSSADQLSATYGHIAGSGSDKNFGTNNIKGETEAIYKQYSSMLVEPANVHSKYSAPSVSLLYVQASSSISTTTSSSLADLPTA